MSELGVTIYEALDQGLQDEEERQLSPELEGVLDLMANTASDDDEGIDISESLDGGDTFQDSIKLSGACQRVIGVCKQRLAIPNESETHFRAVCHALVSEAFELSTFIEKVSRHETDNGEELSELGLQEWVRILIAK